ncbi:hypothetical protein BDV19DRAFT_389732 [Aspergillus venezuelensis]
MSNTTSNENQKLMPMLSAPWLGELDRKVRTLLPPTFNLVATALRTTAEYKHEVYCKEMAEELVAGTGYSAERMARYKMNTIEQNMKRQRDVLAEEQSEEGHVSQPLSKRAKTVHVEEGGHGECVKNDEDDEKDETTTRRRRRRRRRRKKKKKKKKKAIQR